MKTTMLSDFKGDPIEKKPRGVKATSGEAAEVTRAKKALLRRAKRSEVSSSKWLQQHDGPDPKYKNLTTSTGRIGDITRIQADMLSLHYVGENKNEKPPVKLARYWQKVCQVALDFHKDPVLVWEPPNARDFKVATKPLPTFHVITAERHAQLLEYERRCTDT